MSHQRSVGHVSIFSDCLGGKENMKKNNIWAVAQEDAGDNKLQPKTYRLGMNFQLIIEIDEQKNIIDITDYKVRD